MRAGSLARLGRQPPKLQTGGSNPLLPANSPRSGELAGTVRRSSSDDYSPSVLLSPATLRHGQSHGTCGDVTLEVGLVPLHMSPAKHHEVGDGCRLHAEIFLTIAVRKTPHVARHFFPREIAHGLLGDVRTTTLRVVVLSRPVSDDS